MFRRLASTGMESKKRAKALDQQHSPGVAGPDNHAPPTADQASPDFCPIIQRISDKNRRSNFLEAEQLSNAGLITAVKLFKK